MTATDQLVARHATAADRGDGLGLPIVPRHPVLVVSCSDARTDPAHFLDLDPGDALVIRSLGGRVTPGVRDEIVWFQAMAAVASGVSPSIEVMIVHHTDCGAARLADPGVRDLLGGATATDPDRLAELAISTPEDSVRADVDLVRGDPRLPHGLVITGHVYDVETGLLAPVD
jgi:carbonic anhydrase